MKINPLRSVYIHIPFCNRICSYCDFPKVEYKKEVVDKYLEVLEKEISSRYKGEKLETIYIGGGSPSALNVSQLSYLFKIINSLNKSKKIEITIECNVEDLTFSKIRMMKQGGVNRVSLGVQSFNHGFLRQLNRYNTSANVEWVIKQFRALNITNINIDLMFGFKRERQNQLALDLRKVLSFKVPHISIYSLIIEEGTVLAINNYERLNDDDDSYFYEFICKTLTEAGYHHYEVSNFSIKGYQSLHNLVYWHNEEYYGFGLGAASYIGNIRSSNTKSLSDYLSLKTTNYVEELDEKKEEEYEFLLGLRLVDGISRVYFQKKYGHDYLDNSKVVSLIQEKKLIYRDGFLYINPEYFYLMNDILINFIS